MKQEYLDRKQEKMKIPGTITPPNWVQAYAPAKRSRQ